MYGFFSDDTGMLPDDDSSDEELRHVPFKDTLAEEYYKDFPKPETRPSHNGLFSNKICDFRFDDPGDKEHFPLEAPRKSSDNKPTRIYLDATVRLFLLVSDF